jgi:monoterpene epsilon-lactone hydrolase
MSEQQRLALDALLREGPLDIGGDVGEQRVIFEQLMAAQPVPDDVRTEPTHLGAIPALDVTVAGQSSRDVVFYLHGGGFVLGTAQASVGLVSEIARRAGAGATTIDYRLAPEHPYPAGLEDALAAYRALTSGTARSTWPWWASPRARASRSRCSSPCGMPATRSQRPRP